MDLDDDVLDEVLAGSVPDVLVKKESMDVKPVARKSPETPVVTKVKKKRRIRSRPKPTYSLFTQRAFHLDSQHYHTETVSELVKWMRLCNTGNNQSISKTLLGINGSGKTWCVHRAANIAGFELLDIHKVIQDSDDMTMKQILGVIQPLLTKGPLRFSKHSDKKVKIVLIDSIDSLTLQDKVLKCVMDVYKLILFGDGKRKRMHQATSFINPVLLVRTGQYDGCLPGIYKQLRVVVKTEKPVWCKVLSKEFAARIGEELVGEPVSSEWYQGDMAAYLNSLQIGVRGTKDEHITNIFTCCNRLIRPYRGREKTKLVDYERLWTASGDRADKFLHHSVPRILDDLEDISDLYDNYAARDIATYQSTTTQEALADVVMTSFWKHMPNRSIPYKGLDCTTQFPHGGHFAGQKNVWDMLSPGLRADVVEYVLKMSAMWRQKNRGKPDKYNPLHTLFLPTSRIPRKEYKEKRPKNKALIARYNALKQVSERRAKLQKRIAQMKRVQKN